MYRMLFIPNYFVSVRSISKLVCAFQEYKVSGEQSYSTGNITAVKQILGATY